MQFTKRRIFRTAAAVGLVAVFLLLLPPVRARVNSHAYNWRAQIKYALRPPEKEVFIPQAPVATIVSGTLQALTPTVTPTPAPTKPGPTPTPTATLRPTPTSTPLPDSIALTGFRYQDQHGVWNYCGPANLAMALSYWGWKGDRLTVGHVVKPYPEDKNVMPYELADYVTDQTDLKVVQRYGGTMTLLKTFLANGFPVLIEKGAVIRDINGNMTWMGHYNVVSGYDDAKNTFIVQDSYFTPDYLISYTDMEWQWRGFNYIYLVVYPPEKEDQVMQILGPVADEVTALQTAADYASKEIYSHTGIEQYLAWFNRGTSLVYLQDYAGAAAAYDQAFAVYPTIAEADRPWRMMWYQTGPYFAYYYTGRYQDVINLATTTIDTANKPYLEESFYWRGMARLATGDQANAVADFKTAVEYHAGFIPAQSQLDALGIP